MQQIGFSTKISRRLDGISEEQHIARFGDANSRAAAHKVALEAEAAKDRLEAELEFDLSSDSDTDTEREQPASNRLQMPVTPPDLRTPGGCLMRDTDSDSESGGEGCPVNAARASLSLQRLKNVVCNPEDGYEYMREYEEPSGWAGATVGQSGGKFVYKRCDRSRGLPCAGPTGFQKDFSLGVFFIWNAQCEEYEMEAITGEYVEAHKNEFDWNFLPNHATRMEKSQIWALRTNHDTRQARGMALAVDKFGMCSPFRFPPVIPLPPTPGPYYDPSPPPPPIVLLTDILVLNIVAQYVDERLLAEQLSNKFSPANVLVPSQRSLPGGIPFVHPMQLFTCSRCWSDRCSCTEEQKEEKKNRSRGRIPELMELDGHNSTECPDECNPVVCQIRPRILLRHYFQVCWRLYDRSTLLSTRKARIRRDSWISK